MECGPKHSIIKVATFSALMESRAKREQRLTEMRLGVLTTPGLQERIQINVFLL